MRTLASETPKKVSQKVTLAGWISTVRSHGKLIFLDIRDRSGFVQAVGDSKLSQLKPEYVVELTGTVRPRPAGMINPDMPTGQVEIAVDDFKILSKAKTLPFDIYKDGRDIDEALRLKYRYLDLRRPRLAKNLKIRSQFVDLCRQYLFKHDFTEIETPLLTKSTPEGARDFVVPSRLQKGKFYALPQAPQQYKQLLMVAGLERYFQIARCLRDEDLRADRGFEHTQIDIEMSFVKREDVMRLAEAMFTETFEALGARIKQKPFPVFTYKQAMAKFVADKFDLRNDKEKKENLCAFAWVVDFPFFEKTDEGKWTFTHNPFSQPKDEHLDWHLKSQNIDQILTSQYDLVCNGYEVGGGSIRAHKPEVLKATYKTMGYLDQEIEESIGHMLKAFEYGAPPHGGIAPGIDRLLMVLLGEKSMKETLAFPMTASGITAVMDAPSRLGEDQLKELGIAVKK